MKTAYVYRLKKNFDMKINCTIVYEGSDQYGVYKLIVKKKKRLTF